MSLSREEIASRYGMALFEYAKENARLALVHDEVDELIKVLQENPKFELLMASPLLSSNDKKQILKAVAAEMTVEMANFLNLVLEYGRFADLGCILQAFDKFYDREMNEASGVAISAIALDDEQLAAISKSYANKFNLSNIHLTNQVDANILGGVVLKVGDHIIYGSIKNKLQQIRKQLSISKRGETIEH